MYLCCAAQLEAVRRNHAAVYSQSSSGSDQRPTQVSVHWGVIPAQPKEPGFQEWLQKAGIEVPQLSGRYPTIDELLTVLQSFAGLPIHNDLPHSISLGRLDSVQYALILGHVQPDQSFRFHFDGYGCREATMVHILYRLSTVCGPIVLYEGATGTPVVVDSSTDVESAMEDWLRRSRLRHDEMSR